MSNPSPPPPTVTCMPASCPDVHAHPSKRSYYESRRWHAPVPHPAPAPTPTLKHLTPTASPTLHPPSPGPVHPHPQGRADSGEPSSAAAAYLQALCGPDGAAAAKAEHTRHQRSRQAPQGECVEAGSATWVCMLAGGGPQAALAALGPDHPLWLAPALSPHSPCLPTNRHNLPLIPPPPPIPGHQGPCDQILPRRRAPHRLLPLLRHPAAHAPVCSQPG